MVSFIAIYESALYLQEATLTSEAICITLRTEGDTVMDSYIPVIPVQWEL